MIARFALALALEATLSGPSGSHVVAAEPAPAAAAIRRLPADPLALAVSLEPPAAPATVDPPADTAWPAHDDAAAAAYRVPQVERAPDGEGFILSSDFDVPLTRSLADAVDRGVPLYFVIEFELRRPRWWWYDEVVVERSQTRRLAYHALTRQYRVTVNGVIHPFDTLDAALRQIASVRSWRIVPDADRLSAGTVYEAQVRLRLDTSRLPKPFQIRGLTNRDWNPQAEWKRFTFTLPTPKNAR